MSGSIAKSRAKIQLKSVWTTVKRTEFRVFSCARCGQPVFVCRRCDRGQRYCPRDECACRTRREALRGYRAAYQRTLRGARLHAARQAAYRKRKQQEQKVTDQALMSEPAMPMLSAVLAQHDPAGREDNNNGIQCDVGRGPAGQPAVVDRCFRSRPGRGAASALQVVHE